MRLLMSMTLGLSVYGIEDTGTNTAECHERGFIGCSPHTIGNLLCWFLVTALAGVPQALSFIGEDPQGCQAQHGIIPRSSQPA